MEESILISLYHLVNVISSQYQPFVFMIIANT